MADIELLPCPFCGHEAETVDNGRTTIGRGKETAYVTCTWCDDVKTAQTYGEHREAARERAAQLWNTRVPAHEISMVTDDRNSEG